VLILDTNVLSELMKPQPLRSQSVDSWIARIEPRRVFTTAICVAEILAGIGVMPEGQRRNEKRASAERIFGLFSEDRVLPFDRLAALAYADATGARRRRGLHTDPIDLQIAGIAISNQMAVATRNLGDFEGTGVELVDPWSA
jgi:predicted nucleic acid-binding protein